LIAMVLSSFIILGIMQLYQGVARYLSNSRDTMALTRTVCLLFNQMERDLSTAYIPFLMREEKGIKDADTKKDDTAQQEPTAHKTPEDQKKEDERYKEQRKKFFIGTIDEQAEFTKIGKRKGEQLKVLSFICSNPLHIHGEKRIRLVRVVYEVVFDKQRSTRDEKVYKLVRKETNTLNNIFAKVDEYSPEQKRTIRSYDVADNIKGIFIEYVSKKEKEKESAPGKKKEYIEVSSFTWGDKEERQGKVPQKVLVWLDIWNEKKTRSYRYHVVFPVLSYPTIDVDKDKKDKQQDEGTEKPKTSVAPVADQQMPNTLPVPGVR